MTPADSREIDDHPGTEPDACPRIVEVYCRYIEQHYPIDAPLELLIDRIEQQRTLPC